MALLLREEGLAATVEELREDFVGLMDAGFEALVEGAVLDQAAHHLLEEVVDDESNENLRGAISARFVLEWLGAQHLADVELLRATREALEARDR